MSYKRFVDLKKSLLERRNAFIIFISGVYFQIKAVKHTPDNYVKHFVVCPLSRREV